MWYLAVTRNPGAVKTVFYSEAVKAVQRKNRKQLTIYKYTKEVDNV